MNIPKSYLGPQDRRPRDDDKVRAFVFLIYIINLFQTHSFLHERKRGWDPNVLSHGVLHSPQVKRIDLLLNVKDHLSRLNFRLNLHRRTIVAINPSLLMTLLMTNFTTKYSQLHCYRNLIIIYLSDTWVQPGYVVD